MGIGRFAAGALMFAVAAVGVNSHAVSLTFDEFDRLMADQRENFIQTALHFYYYGYKNNPRTSTKATCMFGLNDRIVEDGKSYLWVRIISDIDSARINTATRNSVEGVIKATIDRECRAQ